MENFSDSSAPPVLGENTSYVLYVRDKDEIKLYHSFMDLDDLVQILYVAIESNLLMESVCSQLEEEEIAVLKNVFNKVSINKKEQPAISPLSMSKIR